MIRKKNYEQKQPKTVLLKYQDKGEILKRDDMGRVVGEGFRVGNSCTPVVDSCQCMAKSIQYCKVKKKKEEESTKHFLEIFR